MNCNLWSTSHVSLLFCYIVIISFFKNNNFVGLFEVIFVFCILFEKINSADYLQFDSVYPPVSYSFNLDTAEQLHVELILSMKAKVTPVLILLKNLM